MSTYTEAYLRRIASLVKADGEERKVAAGFTGSMHDGGGGALIANADAFIAGLERRLPNEWLKYANEAVVEKDPEYATYKRLQKKFGSAR